MQRYIILFLQKQKMTKKCRDVIVWRLYESIVIPNPEKLCYFAVVGYVKTLSSESSDVYM